MCLSESISFFAIEAVFYHLLTIKECPCIDLQAVVPVVVSTSLDTWNASKDEPRLFRVYRAFEGVEFISESRE